MKEFTLYLMKSGIWIAVFWSLYRIFLRKETFYKFNRFFLLAGLVASFLIPLYSYHYLVVIDWKLMANDPHQVPTFPLENVAWRPDLWFTLLMIYLSGTVWLLVHRFIGIWKIRKIIKQQGYTREADSKIIHLTTNMPTFSIFNYIFANSSQKMSETERKLIYEHEKAHIEQRHRIDLMLSHTVCIVQWFNPFIWLYLQAIKQNHEFLADKAVLRKGYSLALYRAVLINYTFNAPVFTFANAFAQYNKSKRIDMMMKEVSRPVKKCAVLLLIPALAVFFWAFSEPEYKVGLMEPTHTTESELMTTNMPNEKSGVTSDTVVQKRLKGEIAVVEYGEKATNGVIIIKTKENSDKPLFIIDGKESLEDGINSIDPANIESITVLKDSFATKTYGEKGRNGVVMIELKIKNQDVF